jgi:hypothetical protein
MDGSKPQVPLAPSARNQVEIVELYQRCLSEERKTTKLDLDKLKLLLAKELFFRPPLFEPPPVVDESSAIDKEIDFKIRWQLWEAGKYRRILDGFRTQTERKGRLFLLARWLSLEKVCEPEGIIGIDVLRRMAKKAFRGLSPTDFHHADRVRAWLPYFERLVDDLRLRNQVVSEVVRLGYEEAAVLAANRKRGAVPAACEWLADRHTSSRKVDAPTLRNAYSRVYGPKRRPSRDSHSSR